MSRNSSAEPVALPTDQELVLKVIPMPGDCNPNGDIFGGWVMAHVDLAGSVQPARYTRGRMATVAVNEFVFKQPVSPEEETRCKEAKEGCPVEAIGDNGA